MTHLMHMACQTGNAGYSAAWRLQERASLCETARLACESAANKHSKMHRGRSTDWRRTSQSRHPPRPFDTIKDRNSTRRLRL